MFPRNAFQTALNFSEAQVILSILARHISPSEFAEHYADQKKKRKPTHAKCLQSASVNYFCAARLWLWGCTWSMSDVLSMVGHTSPGIGQGAVTPPCPSCYIVSSCLQSNNNFCVYWGWLNGFFNILLTQAIFPSMLQLHCAGVCTRLICE